MLTSDFKYLKFPFEEFNPPQTEAIGLVENDCNLIAALNTSTGKTAIAFCFFAHELRTKPDKKCVYVSPLKAISQERVGDFELFKEWQNETKIIGTGDFFAAPEDFERARLIVVTSETLDSKTRNEKTHGKWLREVGVLVLDELHLLDEAVRGAALETALVNFTRINPDARLIGLSATMSNAREVGQWFKRLNGKPTFVVASDWRPVKLRLHWVGIRSKNKHSTEQDMLNTAADVVDTNKGDKTLLFVHAKRLGYRLAEEITRRGHMCHFYHAGLKREQRVFLENTFKSPVSGLNALVTTSALAMGVNL